MAKRHNGLTNQRTREISERNSSFAIWAVHIHNVRMHFDRKYFATAFFCSFVVWLFFSLRVSPFAFAFICHHFAVRIFQKHFMWLLLLLLLSFLPCIKPGIVVSFFSSLQFAFVLQSPIFSSFFSPSPFNILSRFVCLQVPGNVIFRCVCRCISTFFPSHSRCVALLLAGVPSRALRTHGN